MPIKAAYPPPPPLPHRTPRLYSQKLKNWRHFLIEQVTSGLRMQTER